MEELKGLWGGRWDCEPRGDSVSTYILLQDEGVPQCRPCLFDTKLNNGVVQSGQKETVLENAIRKPIPQYANNTNGQEDGSSW